MLLAPALELTVPLAVIITTTMGTILSNATMASTITTTQTVLLSQSRLQLWLLIAFAVAGLSDYHWHYPATNNLTSIPVITTITIALTIFFSIAITIMLPFSIRYDYDHYYDSYLPPL